MVKATFEMAKVKTGALMVIERGTPLNEIERTGIEIDGLISSQLLINIFEHNTPLHDGAVVLSGNKVVAATCYLPLSDNMAISKDLGTRHRAAVGISEVSDSLTVVVSEETAGSPWRKMEPAPDRRQRGVEERSLQADAAEGGPGGRDLKSGREGSEMKERILNNFSLKLISFLLAFFLWLLVVNVSNPMITGTREVPVEIENEDILEESDLTYEIAGKSTVTGAVHSGHPGRISHRAVRFPGLYRSAGPLRCDRAVPVNLEVVGHQDLINSPQVNPGVVHVETEELQRKRFDLKVTTRGEPEEGYALGEITLDPEYLYISGPVSQWDRSAPWAWRST